MGEYEQAQNKARIFKDFPPSAFHLGLFSRIRVVSTQQQSNGEKHECYYARETRSIKQDFELKEVIKTPRNRLDMYLTRLKAVIKPQL